MKKFRTMVFLAIAVLLLPTRVFAAGGTESAQPKEAPLTISWYIRASEPSNFDSVMEAVNKHLNETMNMNLDLVCVEPGEWKDKMPLMLAAGEKFDLTWSASWGGFLFPSALEKGAYLDITDMVKEEAKESWELIPQSLWNGVRMQGRLYSAPNYQITYGQTGILMRKDVLDRNGIDPESMKTLDGLKAALATVKKNEPDIYPLVDGSVVYYYYQDELNARNIFQYTKSIYFWVDVNTGKVMPIDRRSLDVTRDFYLKGYFSPDVMTIKIPNDEFKTGKYFAMYSRYKPGGSADQTAALGIDVVVVPITRPTLGSPLPTMTSVSSTAVHPREALRLWNRVNIDKELFNLLVFGLEGQDYTKTGPNRIERNPDGFLLPAWMLGNQFNAFLLPGQPDDVWEETIRMNEEAEPNPLADFTMDIGPVNTEVTNLRAVVDEFNPIIANGLMDVDELLAKYEQRRKEAGWERLVAEFEKQWAEFSRQ